MIEQLPPGLLMIVGALFVPLFRGRWQQLWMLLLPIASGLCLIHQSALAEPVFGIDFEFFTYQLLPVRIDRLSLVWGHIFHIAAFLSVIFSLHVKDPVQNVMALAYAGAAVGGVFAGDLITLFVYWELTAITSVFLVWAGRTERSYRAGMRYLIIQVGSGVVLLAGIILLVANGGSLIFDNLLDRDNLSGLAKTLFFIAFGIKAAFPLLHNWLQDAYPEATPTGAVWLSAFTTKMAIYALARGFAGAECLIWIGAAMTVFPIFYAVIENDLRRVLAYSLNNQLGFMVVGIGIGTDLSLNGTASHAFAHILYKGLLFMSMGAVLMRTGTAKGSELGGLYKSMPWTATFCIIGAASISAFPFFSGFVTKSLIMKAAADEHYFVVWLVLLFASAGVLHHSGIKIPFCTFFAHDSGKRVKEAPLHMLIAMGITAALCILIGIYPQPLYAILPFEMEYTVSDAYSRTHVITQYQLLIWAALAFTWLKRTGIEPPEQRSVNLDTDWFYRKLSPIVVESLSSTISQLSVATLNFAQSQLDHFLSLVRKLYGPKGVFARTWSTGDTVIWAAIMLGTYLLFYYQIVARLQLP